VDVGVVVVGAVDAAGCVGVVMVVPAFTLFPPEINSALMFGGAGSGPLFMAASAWDGLASDLSGAASSFQSVVTGLIDGPWAGPASASMVAAAAPYVSWMSATAAQAEQAAGQAKAAAGAYETAFGLTVPPSVIAANRTLLASLISTNILGQNTPAIAATETHYAEMWAQDAAAMYGYAGSSAAASTLTSANRSSAAIVAPGTGRGRTRMSFRPSACTTKATFVPSGEKEGVHTRAPSRAYRTVSRPEARSRITSRERSPAVWTAIRVEPSGERRGCHT